MSVESSQNESFQQKMSEIHQLWELEIKGMRCGLPNKTMGAIPADFIQKVMNGEHKSSSQNEDSFSGLCE